MKKPNLSRGRDGKLRVSRDSQAADEIAGLPNMMEGNPAFLFSALLKEKLYAPVQPYVQNTDTMYQVWQATVQARWWAESWHRSSAKMHLRGVL